MQTNLPCCIIDPIYPSIASFAEHYDYDLLGQPISMFRQYMRDPLKVLRLFLQNNRFMLGFMAFILFALLCFIYWLIRNASDIWLVIVLVYRFGKDQLASKEKLTQSKEDTGFQAADDIAASVYRTFTGLHSVYEGATNQPIPINLDDFEAVRFVSESNLVQNRNNQRLLYAYRSVSRHFPRVYPAGEVFDKEIREKVDQTMADMEDFERPVSQLQEQEQQKQKQQKQQQREEEKSRSPSASPRGILSKIFGGTESLDELSILRESLWSKPGEKGTLRKRFKTLHRTSLVRSGKYGVIDESYLSELRSRNIRDPFDNLRFRHKLAPGSQKSVTGASVKALSKEELQRLMELNAWTEEYRKRVRQAEEEARRALGKKTDQLVEPQLTKESGTKSVKSKSENEEESSGSEEAENKERMRDERIESLLRFQPKYFTSGKPLPPIRQIPDLERINSTLERRPFRQYLPFDRSIILPSSLSRSKTSEGPREIPGRLFQRLTEDEIKRSHSSMGPDEK